MLSSRFRFKQFSPLVIGHGDSAGFIDFEDTGDRQTCERLIKYQPNSSVTTFPNCTQIGNLGPGLLSQVKGLIEGSLSDYCQSFRQKLDDLLPREHAEILKAFRDVVDESESLT